MPRDLPTPMSPMGPMPALPAMFEFLLERAKDDAREAVAGGATDHVLLDGSHVTRRVVERTRAAMADGGAPPRLRRSVLQRSQLYADHPDFRAEWRWAYDV